MNICGVVDGSDLLAREGCPTTVQDAVGRVSIPATVSPDDETGLIRKAQAGDRSAFAILIDRYWDRLYRWLFHLTRDVHQAEDLAQETFLKAYAAITRFQAGSNFRAWLFRIGHNNFVNVKRANRHMKQPMPIDVEEKAAGPMSETLSREALDLLHKGIARLPQDFRMALLMRVEEDLSFKEIAEILDITEETARWRVFKARQKLMSILSPELLPKMLQQDSNES